MKIGIVFLRNCLALIVSFSIGFCAADVASAQVTNSKLKQEDKFRQLEEHFPTGTSYRNAAGAPGHEYWQQKVDYEIDVEIDDEKQILRGKETITYTNNSPDELSYLWLQLDSNIHSPNSDSNLSEGPAFTDRTSFNGIKAYLGSFEFDGSTKIGSVKNETNQELHFAIVKTNMRVDLQKPLRHGETTVFTIVWEYNINDAKAQRGRTGYEFFPEDKNYIYEMAQWFPRLCAYTDYTGWQHKQYLGQGEFTLEFGDYVVRITVPNDHVVAATGTLMNPNEVLSEAHRARLQDAAKSIRPIFIVTPDEAKAAQAGKPTGKKTWIFKADNVRDYAFASSRKFIWDAMLHSVEGQQVWAMSYYPNEAEPLWSKYSTHAIVHTLNVYSRYTFRYPYPTAISVNGPVGGMEYPMICFNGPRPEKDGTYSKRTKYGLISVVIHEVGHNYFPMIVNSDERQWMWMDEGLNTFLQYLAETEWEENYPSQRGEPRDVANYMLSANQVPIMTASDSLLQVGPNAYQKPATALNILRETILGRELFDFAFKEYARRWQFKRPTPYDFFRTMEDASGVDLDWFWRGWFYTTDHVDISVESVEQLNVNTQNPDIEKPLQKAARDGKPETLSEELNKSLKKRATDFPELNDFYNTHDELNVTDGDRESFKKAMERLSEEERNILAMTKNFYIIKFKNIGGVVMPLIIEAEFEDGSKQTYSFPAETWRLDSNEVSKMIVSDKVVKSITLDPRDQIADADESNNTFPRTIKKSRFQVFKEARPAGGRAPIPEGPNEMQKAGLGKKPDAASENKEGEKKPEMPPATTGNG